MTQDQKDLIKTFDRIIKRQLFELLEQGATIDQAKDFIFNLFNTKYPETFCYYLSLK
jgi:hypothetical protein